jgi:hypothetical protein
MPKARLSDDYKDTANEEQFPAMKLETGEYARFTIPNEDEIWWEYVHSIRAPVINEDGSPVIEDKKRKDGTVWGQDFALTFVGQRICLGDYAVIEGTGKGLDPDRCPACASAARGTRDMLPSRRFAVPVIKYTPRRRSGTEIQDPPGAALFILKLTQKMYNALMENKGAIRELLDLGPDAEISLKQADLVLYCEDGGFQRLTFKPPMRPAYRDQQVFALIGALWANEANRPTDNQMKSACGRFGPGDREYMTRDVSDAERRWRQAETWGTARQDPTGSGPVSGAAPDLDKTLDEMLAEHPGGSEEFMSPAQRAEKAADAAGDPFAAPAAAPAAAPPAAPADDPFAGGAPAQPASAAGAGAPEMPDDPFGGAREPVPAAAGPRPGAKTFEQIIDEAS